MKKLLALLLALLLSIALIGCSLLNSAVDDRNGTAEDSGETQQNDDSSQGYLPLDVNGSYTTKEDVALYLWFYGELPDNFITKKEAQNLGWPGGSLEEYAPGYCIGGSHFGNYEGILPEDQEYRECDIDTLGKDSRGPKRLVYADSKHIYYTEDHYESFTQITFTDDYQMIEEGVG